MPSTAPLIPPPPARGFALIEALIALLVFSIAVLGLVGLQVSLTRAATGAKYRADAAFLASELVGTMWADSQNLDKYKNSCASYAPCKQWTDKVGTSLPLGTPTVSVCLATDNSASCKDDLGNTATGRVSIIIQWTLPQEGLHQYTTASTVNL